MGLVGDERNISTVYAVLLSYKLTRRGEEGKPFQHSSALRPETPAKESVYIKEESNKPCPQSMQAWHTCSHTTHNTDMQPLLVTESSFQATCSAAHLFLCFNPFGSLHTSRAQ